MPIFDWRCERCKRTEAVVSTVEDRDVPPPASDATDCTHVWVRLPPGGQRLMLGASWGPGKPGRTTR
jgi:hypothetical protein